MLCCAAVWEVPLCSLAVVLSPSLFVALDIQQYPALLLLYLSPPAFWRSLGSMPTYVLRVQSVRLLVHTHDYQLFYLVYIVRCKSTLNTTYIRSLVTYNIPRVFSSCHYLTNRFFVFAPPTATLCGAPAKTKALLRPQKKSPCMQSLTQF